VSEEDKITGGNSEGLEQGLRRGGMELILAV
jgi:hypothetical protein